MARTITLFLAGDVMTGRGIDQALAHPGRPALHEPAVSDARHYVALAERAAGPMRRPVSPAHLWGEALPALERARPAARIVNLETSITTSDDWFREKQVHYRMHPDNIGCLTAAGIDVASVANNHTLDWGRVGLLDTLATLHHAGIRTVGGGESLDDARRPAILTLPDGGRVIVVAVGSWTAGIPRDWRATAHRPGLDLVDVFNAAEAESVAARLAAEKRPGDVGIVSIHWGGNWGHDVDDAFVRFAHRLVDGGADIVHGHSSHHVRPIEVYRDRLILYGCGDLIDDYEGIAGDEEFRGDLGLLYFPVLEPARGRLVGLRMEPTRMHGFSLRRAGRSDADWLAATLSRTSERFGTVVDCDAAGGLMLRM